VIAALQINKVAARELKAGRTDVKDVVCSIYTEVETADKCSEDIELDKRAAERDASVLCANRTFGLWCIGPVDQELR
jgi:hypothetical protein